MSQPNGEQDLLPLAEAVRAACLTSALESYEDASLRGLCHEGAWECAIGAIRSLNLRFLLTRYRAGEPLTEGKETPTAQD